MPSPRLIALYLPQYHPIPENDRWWGTGFTEWTNTAKAQPLFPGHYQPHVPADLGFYDLRVPETRAAQAELARAYGIEAFCYYHYWFGGKQILERPLQEVVASGEPDFPFCVCWANETWSGIWHGAPSRVLIEQTYPGEHDHRAHFASLLPAFRDPRYVRVEGKPLFAIYRPTEVPHLSAVLALWRRLARDAGLPGLHLVGFEVDGEFPDFRSEQHGFDAAIVRRFVPSTDWMPWARPFDRVAQYVQTRRLQHTGRVGPLVYAPTVHRYADAVEAMVPRPAPGRTVYPCAIPNWDNTPRSGRRGVVLHDSTPSLFREHLARVVALTRNHPPDRRIVMLKSWNEWAEGNHLEPDLRFGHAYLEVVRDVARGRMDFTSGPAQELQLEAAS